MSLAKTKSRAEKVGIARQGKVPRLTGGTLGFLRADGVWAEASTPVVPGVDGWTDDGGIVRLTTGGDTVAIGTTTMSGAEKVRIIGDLRVEGRIDLAFGTGTANILIGAGSGGAAIAAGAANNIAVGASALGALTTGDNNIAIGAGALAVQTTENDCIAIGVNALAALVAGGVNNIAIGTNALDAATGADNNIAIGTNALGANVGGQQNIALGHQALLLNLGSFNIAIGYRALDANDTANNQVAIGVDALGANNSGDENVAIGSNAMRTATSSQDCVAVGMNALDALTTGSFNTAVGRQSSGSMTTGARNTSVGYNSLDTSVGTSNDNTAIGNDALGGTTSGDGNSSLGSDSGIVNTTGNNNTYLGFGAGFTGSGTGLTNTVCIGFQSIVTTSDSMILGNSSMSVGIRVTAPLAPFHVVGNVLFAHGTITTDIKTVDTSVTWNAVGVTFTAMRLNVTDTASAAASILMDLHVGGVQKFTVYKTGDIQAGAANPATAGTVRLPNAATVQFRNAANGANIQVLTLTAADIIEIGSTTGITLSATDGGLRINNQTDRAGAGVGTITNTPNAGGGNPVFWVPISIAGTVRAFPVWAL